MSKTDLEQITSIPNTAQDNNPVSSSVSDNNEILYQEEVRRLAVENKALSVFFGENGRRRGAGPVFRRLQNVLSGTFTSVDVNCTGVGTQAGVEFDVYDWIQPRGRTGESRRVTAVTDTTHWTVDRAWSPDVTVAENLDLQEYLAERLDDLNSRTQNIEATAGITDITGYLRDSVTLTAIAGWLDNNTPYYIDNTLSITISNGSALGTVAHGISNAYTNDRIFNVTWRRQFAPEYEVIYGEGASGLNSGIWLVEWDDTDVKLTRNGSSGDITYKLAVWYK